MIQIAPISADCNVNQIVTIPIDEIIFMGMRVMAKAVSADGEVVYSDLPVAHGLFYPFSFSERDSSIFPVIEKNWYYRALKKTVATFGLRKEYPIVLHHTKNHDKLLIINALDIYYGHVLIKLLNISHYLKRVNDKDILVIVPKYLEWFVPKPCNVIVVDVPLRSGSDYIANLDAIVKQIMSGYSQVFLSKTFNAPHPHNIDLKFHTPIVPANPEVLLNRSEAKQVAFIWREDRTILSGTRIENVALFLIRKFKFNWLLQLLVLNQYCYVNKLYRLLARENDNLEFSVVGFGKKRSFRNGILNHIVQQPTPNLDFDWNNLYSKMKLVIGVHGSNMLFPSGYAPMTLEILPKDRLGNFLQDIILNEPNDCRDILFRYRFLPVGTGVSMVAKTASAMLNNFPQFHKEMMEDVYWKSEVVENRAKTEKR